MADYAILFGGVAALVVLNIYIALLFLMRVKTSAPASSRISALVFDWGGVISHEAYWEWLRRHIPDIEDRKDYFQNLIDRENRGEHAEEELISALAREAGQTAPQVIQEMKDARRLNEDVVSLVRALKSRYKIGLLSNASSHLRNVIAEHNAWDLFDEVLISSEHKMLKPEPQIYKTMCTMLGILPSEAVMVDDRQKNVDGAHGAGMKGILFTDAAALVAELKRLGVSW
jgi:HAD superfamily hydrolase (TIGR01509 family)